MDAVRRLASLGARGARGGATSACASRSRAMRVAVPAAVRGPAFDALLPLLADEVNVKRGASWSRTRTSCGCGPSRTSGRLGKRFGKRTPEVAARVAASSPEAALRALEAGDSPWRSRAVGDVLPEDVTVEREVASDWVVQSEGALRRGPRPGARPTSSAREGLARELVSRIQRMRKEAGYEVSDRIALWIDGADAVREAARAHGAWIGEETLARKLAVAERPTGADLEQRHDLDGHEAVIALRRG